MKTIIVTGTPGTGKTTIAKKLAKRLNYYYLDVNKLVSENKLSKGYDKKRRTKIVDIKKLNKVLIDFIEKIKKINGSALLSRRTLNKTLTKQYIKKNINKKYIKKILNKKIKGIVIDSHLSHYLPKKYVDLAIVAKCDIKELNKRLKKRKYLKNKIQENIQAEIFDVCYNESLERKHKVVTINTAKSFNISSIVNKLGG